MNKKEINNLAGNYAAMFDDEKKAFLQNEKKRIESLSESENRKELNAIKDLLMDMKNEIKTILQK